MTQAAAFGIGVQRAESPGLWILAWRRFCRDRVGLASFLIVVFFFGLMAASGLHLIAADWSKEVGVNYAPPTFAGPAIPEGGLAAHVAPDSALISASTSARGSKGFGSTAPSPPEDSGAAGPPSWIAGPMKVGGA